MPKFRQTFNKYFKPHPVRGKDIQVLPGNVERPAGASLKSAFPKVKTHMPDKVEKKRKATLS